MTPVKDAREVTEIVELVRKYLEPHQPPDYRLEVVPEGVRQEDDWIYVLVEPSRDDVRSYDYTARMVEAELDLQEKEHRNILLIPAFPA